MNQNESPKCPYCKQTFEGGNKSDGRLIYYFCKSCNTVISVTTDHSVSNFYDLIKIKQKLEIPN
jgi:tRNA(Ile2) C34 agmatinyltransferase TiaS